MVIDEELLRPRAGICWEKDQWVVKVEGLVLGFISCGS